MFCYIHVRMKLSYDVSMLLPHLNVFWSLNKFWEYAEGEWSRKNLMKILIFRGRSAQKCSAPQNVLRQKMSLRLSCSLSPTNVGSAKLFPTFKSLNVILKFYTTRLWFEKSHSTHMFPSRTSLLTSFAYTSLPGRMRLFIFSALNWYWKVSHVQLRGTGTDTVWVESLSFQIYIEEFFPQAE